MGRGHITWTKEMMDLISEVWMLKNNEERAKRATEILRADGAISSDLQVTAASIKERWKQLSPEMKDHFRALKKRAQEQNKAQKKSKRQRFNEEQLEGAGVARLQEQREERAYQAGQSNAVTKAFGLRGHMKRKTPQDAGAREDEEISDFGPELGAEVRLTNDRNVELTSGVFAASVLLPQVQFLDSKGLALVQVHADRRMVTSETLDKDEAVLTVTVTRKMPSFEDEFGVGTELEPTQKRARVAHTMEDLGLKIQTLESMYQKLDPNQTIHLDIPIFTSEEAEEYQISKLSYSKLTSELNVYYLVPVETKKPSIEPHQKPVSLDSEIQLFN